ncbi:MAG: hypothetical protein KY459_02345 [Acidobacteria bacterium]|nr:hypothetical protein [Acidobacteriota bacterium]
MSQSAGGEFEPLPKTDLRSRFRALVIERFPFALGLAQVAFENAMDASSGNPERNPEAIRSFGNHLRHALSHLFERSNARNLEGTSIDAEVTPRVTTGKRLEIALDQLIDEAGSFIEREAIRASLRPEERIEILRGMLLTRATDNRLKQFFSSGEVKFEGAPFQGKGFRSLGQEAIYAAPLRLRRGAALEIGGEWTGDVIAPLIRDLGAALAMSPDGDTVRMVLNAQMGKAGPPMNGKDLHIGRWDRGILPASAPLAISSATIAGVAMAFARQGTGRVAVSFIGEGGTSLGEWHEAINVCAARKLPAIFCVQNNQTALSTPLEDQTAVRCFADKALGYGLPGVTVDGTDPDGIAATFAWAAGRARDGKGPALIELVAMRMCGHAHHDDMLYHGREQLPGWSYPELTDQGYADRDAWDYWSRRDPIDRYAALLIGDGVIDESQTEEWMREATELVQSEAQRVIDADWPDESEAGRGVTFDDEPQRHFEVLDRLQGTPAKASTPALEPIETDPSGATFLDAVMLGVRDALVADDRVFVYGEDVGGKYGNAFLLLRPLLEEFGERIVNSPLSEGGILGVCVGAALGGLRPIGEIQFNDFVATGFNQLVNNAAKTRYRWGGEVPMVVRMPWGGLRHAGPYHSQNTEPWFYRTAGLRIVVPSTPRDARALMAAAVADRDPVLYYEHIGLYRDPRIRQSIDDPEPVGIGRAALRRAGSDLLIISWGAFVHRALAVAAKLEGDGVEAAVLDLRTLAPLDVDSVLTMTRHCSRVLILQEDSKRGSVGESIASMIQEQAFDWLDAPVRVVGSLDTPVPYSPPLERAYLPSLELMTAAARKVLEY